MNVSDIPRRTLRERLEGPGIYLHAGPFFFHLRTDVADIFDGIAELYSDFPLATDMEFADFHVNLKRRCRLFRCLHPRVEAVVGGCLAGTPLPLDQAFALFEGTINWCIYTYAHQFFILHAAAFERNDGIVAILPAPPESGKSTLCAALASRGWRLLTDELTLIEPETNQVLPLPRPISLKNESIKVIREFAPESVFGPASLNTVKGTIVHVRPPKQSVTRMLDPSQPAWVVFPQFRAGSSIKGQPIPKPQALLRVAENAVNYWILGTDGFCVLSRLIETVDCHEFEYGNLDEAVSWFNSLPPPESYRKF